MKRDTLTRMRQLRLLSGLTLDDLSVATGIDRGHLSRMERDIVSGSPQHKERISKELGTPVEELFPEGQKAETRS